MTTTKIAIKNIEINRAEGLIEECGIPHIVTTWEAAEALLHEWAVKRAFDQPNAGGYDKVDFTITYVDGETYEGIFDLYNFGSENAETLAAHVEGFVKFYGGLLTDAELPSHLTPYDYADITSDAETRKSYSDFFSRYQIGVLPETALTTDQLLDRIEAGQKLINSILHYRVRQDAPHDSTKEAGLYLISIYVWRRFGVLTNGYQPKLVGFSSPEPFERAVEKVLEIVIGYTYGLAGLPVDRQHLNHEADSAYSVLVQIFGEPDLGLE